MYAESPNTLNYAPRPPLFRRRWLRRKLIFLLLISAIAGSAWHYGPPLYFRARTAIYRNQCFSDALPPDTVVFESDATAATALLKRSGYSPIALGPDQPSATGRNLPACGKLLSSGMDVEPGLEALLFLHRLTTRSGQSRVVAIRFVVVHCPVPDRVIDPPVSFYTNSFLPDIEGAGDYATLRRDWGQPFNAQCYGLWTALNDRSLRFYAGQPDPADSSHFTIGYAAHGQRGTIDGWAQDAANSGGLFGSADENERHWHIRLVVRDGPARGNATIENAGDKFEALYDKDPLDEDAKYLVAGRVMDFGVYADPRAEQSLLWRI